MSGYSIFMKIWKGKDKKEHNYDPLFTRTGNSRSNCLCNPKGMI